MRTKVLSIAAALLLMVQGAWAQDATFYVPEVSVELYKVAPVWKNFDVKAITGTGITPMTNGQSTMVNDNSWYTLDGHRLMSEPTRRGIYIYKGKKTIK